MASDVAGRPIAVTGAVILGTVLLVIATVFVLLHVWNTSPSASRVPMPDPVAVPGPALQSAPQLDLKQYRADKQKLLQGAAWVDAAHGVARIPIGDAMALLAARAASAPARTASASASALASAPTPPSASPASAPGGRP